MEKLQKKKKKNGQNSRKASKEKTLKEKTRKSAIGTPETKRNSCLQKTRDTINEGGLREKRIEIHTDGNLKIDCSINEPTACILTTFGQFQLDLSPEET